MPPLLTIPHHNGAALGVVLLQPQLHDGGLARDAELLINLMFNGQAVGVPAKTTLNVEALHGPVSRDDVLDGRGQEMAVMREASRERRAIVEGVVGVSLRQLDLQPSISSAHTMPHTHWVLQGQKWSAHLPLKGLDLAPSGDDGLLLLRKVDGHGAQFVQEHSIWRGYWVGSLLLGTGAAFEKDVGRALYVWSELGRT